MKTIACFVALGLAFAGAASARELDAVSSFESPQVVTSAQGHDERVPGGKKDGTIAAKYDTAFPTHDTVRSRVRGSI